MILFYGHIVFVIIENLRFISNQHSLLQLYMLSVNDQYEMDLIMVVKSLILSISEAHQVEKPDTCDSSCILRSLVKLLQSSGYDAALCASKWQSCGKVPGGMCIYIFFINVCEI